MKKIAPILTPVGLLIVAAATMWPLMFQPEALNPLLGIVWYKYLYAAGALLMLVGRLFTPSNETDMRLRRLQRIESWSAIFFCVAAFFLFYQDGKPRDWLAFTMAGAAIQVIASVMTTLRRKKLGK